MALGLLLFGIFVIWLGAAHFIWLLTLGPEAPTSIPSFVHDVLTTPAGWAMAGIGVGVGFLFALLVLTVSVVSFPLLLHPHFAVLAATTTSYADIHHHHPPH